MAGISRSHGRRLIVEGTDDKFAVIHLMKRNGVDWDEAPPRLPYVHVAGGVDGVLDGNQLSTEIKSERPRLGIVVDADEDPGARWTRARDALRRAGVQDVPDALPSGGLVVNGPFPGQRIGRWLMPSNEASGTLESFLQELVPATDTLWPYAGKATVEARDHGAELRPGDDLKGRFYAWLAWQSTPGLPFGTAITAGFLRADGNVAQRFVAWFHHLFDA